MVYNLWSGVLLIPPPPRIFTSRGRETTESKLVWLAVGINNVVFLSVLPGNGDGDMEYSEQALLPLLTAYPKVRMEDCKKNVCEFIAIASVLCGIFLTKDTLSL